MGGGRRLVMIRVNIDALPEGVELAGVQFDPSSGAAGLLFRHPSFPVVPDGVRVPDLDAEAKPISGSTKNLPGKAAGGSARE